MLLLLYLFHLLPLRLLHVLLLPLQLPRAQRLDMHFGSRGLRVLQSPLALPAVLVETPIDEKKRNLLDEVENFEIRHEIHAITGEHVSEFFLHHVHVLHSMLASQ